MKFYKRYITEREPINRHGKLGYVLHCEVFMTERDEFVAEMNYRKREKFRECAETDIPDYAADFLKRADTVYSVVVPRC